MVFNEDLLINLLGNKSRLKILLAIWKSKEALTVYKICKSTGLNRLVVRQHIKTLVDGGLVQKRSYGGVFLFTLTLESIEGRALKDFFDKTLK